MSSKSENEKMYRPSTEFSKKAHVKTYDQYLKMYDMSVKDPEGFWGDMAERMVSWDEKWDKVLEWEFETPKIQYFIGGKLNVSYNCLDRHIENGNGDVIALIWEGDDPSQSTLLTYRQLHRKVCKFANVLKSLGVSRGDRVCIFLPMIPELPIAMLACARIGAIHSVVFGGFSADSLKGRIIDSQSKVLVTSDGGYRGGRTIPLKRAADNALEDPEAGCIQKVVVVRRTGEDVQMKAGRDLLWDDLMEDASSACICESMNSEDPLFMLYTSGSTGKPKGVLHTQGGYLVYAVCTFKYIFDYRDNDIFWCTADIGWVTGHTYIVYGPLAFGATSVMFEGVPTYPDAGRFWDVVDKWKVSIFYTAPTAIRALIGKGNDFVTRASRSTLRLLGTVGEPINPEAWKWYHSVVGEGCCPIVDTWWQTETGGILISPLPGAFDLKAGSATLPFFGVVPEIVDEHGKELSGEGQGRLCITKPWPGMARTLYGDHKRFRDMYFSIFPGKYFTGDGARRDKEGYYWITGRIDDVINVSGHRIGTAEVESAINSHPSIAESAVVGFPHDIKGQGIYAFIIAKEGAENIEGLEKALVSVVREKIGPIATPDKIQRSSGLPKTRSGKIMRRILRKIAAGEVDQLGDTSTLADPAVVQDLIGGRK
ncbi:MAG: acetate--CoA ligase [Pseudomonadota bacterium]